MAAPARPRLRSPPCPPAQSRLPIFFRIRGCWIVSTQFTLVPAKSGEPLIAPAPQIAAAVSPQRRFSSQARGAMLWSTNSGRPIFPSRKIALFRLLYDAARMGVAQGGDRKALYLRDRHQCGVAFHGYATRMCATSQRFCSLTVAPPSPPQLHETAVAALRPVTPVDDHRRGARRAQRVMSDVQNVAGVAFETTPSVLIVGAGAAGVLRPP